MQTETFSAYLKDKHRALAQQLDMYGQNPYSMQAQYQMMMNMMMMNMYQNPQAAQLMMMQMMNQGQAQPHNAQHNNLFVRKAKGKPEGEQAAPSNRGKGGSSSYRDRGNKDGGYHSKVDRERKQGAGHEKPREAKKEEEPARVRLDSDNFPPISGNKKQIISDGKNRQGNADEAAIGAEEGKVNREYLIQFFMENRDSIKINDNLKGFTQAQVPIIDRDAEPRIEELDPTPRKEYPGVPSGPVSRKESANFRKTSFNKKKADDDEYVVKADDK